MNLLQHVLLSCIAAKCSKKSIHNFNVLLILGFYLSYRTKAMQDAEAVSNHVERLLHSIGKVWFKTFLH